MVRDETGKWGVDDGHLFHCFQPFSGRKNKDERLQELICERLRAQGSGGAVLKSGSVSHSAVLTLCNPVDCSLPGSSVHGISQAGILEWVAITFSRGSSHPGIESRSPTLQAGGCLGSQTSCHPVCSQGCLSQLEKGACARGHSGAFTPDRALVEQQQPHGG